MNAAVESLGAALGAVQPTLPGHEHQWLRERRASALSRFQQTGLPTLRDEDWKYTSIRNIERRGFTLARSQTGDADSADLASRFGYDSSEVAVLVLRDGALVGSHGELPEGVQVCALAEALGSTELAALLDKYLGKIARSDADGFAASSASALADGILIHAPAGSGDDRPLLVLHVASGVDDLMCAPRILVVAGAGARLRMVEHYVSLADGAQLVNTVTEVVLAEGAEVEHTRLQEQCRASFHVATVEAQLAGNASFTSHAMSVGAALARHDINAHLLGEQARCEMNGLYLGAGRQHVDFHTRIHHRAVGCASAQTYKGILGGSARGVFNGQVHVHPQAQQSDAQQSNHNLLLSRNAEVDTKPQLEILADDVTCSHGATVGQLDSNMLFYLRSRGVPEAQARGLLTYGFAHDIVERLSLESIAARMEHLLVEVLPHGDELRDIVEIEEA